MLFFAPFFLKLQIESTIVFSFACVPDSVPSGPQVLLLCAALSLAGNIVYLVGASHVGGNETALLLGRLVAGAGGGACARPQ